MQGLENNRNENQKKIIGYANKKIRANIDMQINKQIEKRVKKKKKTNLIYRFANKKIIERKNNYNISGFWYVGV